MKIKEIIEIEPEVFLIKWDITLLEWIELEEIYQKEMILNLKKQGYTK